VVAGNICLVKPEKSSAKILLELCHHALDRFFVWMRFEPYVFACLELREILLTCLVSWINMTAQATMKFRLAEWF
jgi:hypothetical protein